MEENYCEGNGRTSPPLFCLRFVRKRHQGDLTEHVRRNKLHDGNQRHLDCQNSLSLFGPLFCANLLYSVQYVHEVGEHVGTLTLHPPMLPPPDYQESHFAPTFSLGFEKDHDRRNTQIACATESLHGTIVAYNFAVFSLFLRYSGHLLREHVCRR